MIEISQNSMLIFDLFLKKTPNGHIDTRRMA